MEGVRSGDRRCAANEGPVRIQCKCLVYVALLFPKQNYKVLPPNFHIPVLVCICERFIYPHDLVGIYKF